jgi:GxxExxY protein
LFEPRKRELKSKIISRTKAPYAVLRTMKGMQRHEEMTENEMGKIFDEGFRADIVVEDKVILELKSVEATNPVHKKQVLTYLRLIGCKLGYLLNFGEALMKDGITRLINGEVQ